MADTSVRRVERLSGDESCPRMRGWPLLIGFALAVPAGAALYGVGWIYHLLRWSPGVRARLRRLDHAVIYLFIAATYTPVVIVGIHDAVGYWLLAATWAGAALGATAKLVH